MHHLRATTSIILLFHELHLEKMANHAITPIAGAASYISSLFNLDSTCVPYTYQFKMIGKHVKMILVHGAAIKT